MSQAEQDGVGDGKHRHQDGGAGEHCCRIEIAGLDRSAVSQSPDRGVHQQTEKPRHGEEIKEPRAKSPSTRAQCWRTKSRECSIRTSYATRSSRQRV